ncbi:kinesin-like protein KIN-10A isoform X2 [Selaginella moellendorffii]|uniref:kinesin-like protein KIN-10A isoform X2 n=1 Tax=Selaginella moellendorffii TaxID=88036 RepID=UPI000D1C5014|nr:kinesin-like protein KIN-10A isoform X2 [Selaginella moellendorffii]|eukprot:XP_024532840.1 kinesin-like protein KIN-10A isoform X2 [Selaginella moellendorffii]
MGSHPVEVVGRIRGHPDGKGEQSSALSVLAGGKSVRLRCDQGYRDFVLDGVSVAEEENLRAFYAKYVEARVDDVRAGGRCTVMMYGPTGAGKSHTMFGSSKEAGVAYLALHQIMKSKLPVPHGNRTNVTANVLEIYNEEVYDLLASNCVASPGPKSLKPIPGRARLEVRGGKAKNATFISGEDPSKLVNEIANVEKRRVVKSTNCNSRSSRSHCMVVLNVSGAGGKLILVDMAGSENSDQAGSIGSEAKIQTGKINQGNGALRRVVECIANGDPYIPYRDSKLTMLLQDSFEEDGAKILMILCASPDSRDAYKTICTLEYGAKAKCIVRLPSSPPKDRATFADGMEAVLLARLRHKDECIERLRQEYDQKERERLEIAQKLIQREEDLKVLTLRTEKMEEEKVKRFAELQGEMERMMKEKADELRREMELELQLQVHKICPENGQYRLAELEKVIQDQRQEIAVLHLRAERAESQVQEFLQASSQAWAESNDIVDMDLSNSICMSRDFTNGSTADDRAGDSSVVLETPASTDNERGQEDQSDKYDTPKDGVNRNLFALDKVHSEVEVPWSEIGLFKTGWLPIIPEEADEEALKPVETSSGDTGEDTPQPLCPSNLEKKFELQFEDKGKISSAEVSVGRIEAVAVSPVGTKSTIDHCTSHERVASRKARIENIFLLCGNHRELAKSPRRGDAPSWDTTSDIQDGHLSPFRPRDRDSLKAVLDFPSTPEALHAATTISNDNSDTEVYVKWESTKMAAGKPICSVRVSSSTSLADLRTKIGLHVISPSDFSFSLGDFGGAPIDRAAENALLVRSLPLHENNPNWRLACLRTSATSPARSSPSSRSTPFKPVENRATSTSPPSASSNKLVEVRGGEENIAPVAEIDVLSRVCAR